MANSENDISKSQTPNKNIHEEADIREDEVNLMDYFLVLWKHKYFILTMSVLPALIVSLFLYLSPRSYKAIYLYDTDLGEKDYKILLDRFYCAENLERIVTRLKENNLGEYAQQIAGAEGLEKFRNLVVLSSFFQAGGSSGTDIGKLQKSQQAKCTLLTMTVEGRPKKDVYAISSIIKDDFEKVIPIYSVKGNLTNNIRTLKTNMAKIEEERFGLGLESERKKATLGKPRDLKSEGSDNVQSNITLQFFNMDANSAYLPLAYRTQAIDSQIISPEESIRANEEKLSYYKKLVGINERILDEIKSKASLYYTIQEFHSFVTGMAGEYKDKESKDYLSAYIKRIENRVTDIVPVTEKPTVYPVAKGTVKKSGAVFVIALMISTFAAFLREGLEKNKARVL